MNLFTAMLADDEPLVLVGLQSIIDWKAHGVEIVATTHNGRELLDMIRLKQPDIVVSDVRMPLMDGLEVMETLAKEGKRLPVFILLSGYEEFAYVRKAISLNAVDYLVKLDLTRESLGQAVDKAVQRVKELGGSSPKGDQEAMLELFRGRFLVRLLNGLVDSKAQYERQVRDLAIPAPQGHCSVALVAMSGRESGGAGDLARLYLSAANLLKDTLGRLMPCMVVSLDLRHVAVVCFVGEKERRSTITGAFFRAFDVLKRSLSIDAKAAVGEDVEGLFDCHRSYLEAREAMAGADPLAWAVPQDMESFPLDRYHAELSRVFDELDGPGFRSICSRLADDLEHGSASAVTAVSSISMVVTMIFSLVPDGEKMVERVFRERGRSWNELFALQSPEAWRLYLTTLGEGLEAIWDERRQDYRSDLVHRVQLYIKSNVNKKLSLGDVAEVFGISENYLSLLFSRYGSEGFVAYTTKVKMEKAKELLSRRDAKIYEVASSLGFENAFYFSKVFKRYEGLSPRDFQHKEESGHAD